LLNIRLGEKSGIFILVLFFALVLVARTQAIVVVVAMMMSFDALVWLGGLWLGVRVSRTLFLLERLLVSKREVSFPQI
jgi:hypothetical protein